MYPISREYSCSAESFSTDIDCSAATKEEIVNTGVTVASLFFHNVFRLASGLRFGNLREGAELLLAELLDNVRLTTVGHG